MTNLLAKVAKIFLNFLGYFDKLYVSIKSAVTTFLASSGKIGLL